VVVLLFVNIHKPRYANLNTRAASLRHKPNLSPRVLLFCTASYIIDATKTRKYISDYIVISTLLKCVSRGFSANLALYHTCAKFILLSVLFTFADDV
jgi:hypothetical protein